jgi:hypothetical protein
MPARLLFVRPRGRGVEMDQPAYIDAADLAERLAMEVKRLGPEDRAWWAAHRCEPFVLSYRARCHYAVARDGDRALVFFDDEDEFGSAAISPDGSGADGGLSGDLVDAVRWFRLYHRAEPQYRLNKHNYPFEEGLT